MSDILEKIQELYWDIIEYSSSNPSHLDIETGAQKGSNLKERMTESHSIDIPETIKKLPR